jgi:hypothetical protein
MKIVLFQSCDGPGFAAVLDATARANREFCRRHDVEYRRFMGLKRGLWPWHACFNRLYMLKELIDEGHAGWALHIDGDAYVCELNFPIRDYLAGIAHKAGVAVLSGATDAYWDINNGVLFFNLGHPTAIAMVNEWISRHEKIFPDPQFLSRQWPVNFDDQHQMQMMLLEHREWYDDLHIESNSVMNSMHASFIRHHLRVVTPDFQKRVQSIQREVEEVMENDRLLGRA